MTGPDGEEWNFYTDEYALLDAMSDGSSYDDYNYDDYYYDDEYYDYDDSYEAAVYEIYLVPQDFASTGYYGYLITYDTTIKDWEFWDSYGNVCYLDADLNELGIPDGFTVKNN
jgi:hypothetical protein